MTATNMCSNFGGKWDSPLPPPPPPPPPVVSQKVISANFNSQNILSLPSILCAGSKLPAQKNLKFGLPDLSIYFSCIT